jgi:hypothetical protein
MEYTIRDSGAAIVIGDAERAERVREPPPPFALERLRIERYVEGHEQRSTTASSGEAAIRQVLYHPASTAAATRRPRPERSTARAGRRPRPRRRRST